MKSTNISPVHFQTKKININVISPMEITFTCPFMEKEMVTPSSTLAWKIPWTEEPGRLHSMGSQRGGHD